MGFAGFVGNLLIAGGPGLAIFCVFVAPKSFLVLLFLASLFAWLVSLMLTAALFRGFVPLAEHRGALSAALVVGVAMQEATRYCAWLAHRRILAMLAEAARLRPGTRLGAGERHALALTQGLAHGAAHSFFFYFSWLPLMLGDGTFYVDACPQMSFFLAGALLSLAFLLLHTCAMPVAFDGLGKRQRGQWLAVPAAHLGAALLTLGNLADGGCVAVLPLLLLGAAGMAAAAAWVCWRDVGTVARRVSASANDNL
ncbi:hypothetical protein WJX81_003457 [Elliptochloris bilobata]|uniref:Gamma-secretase subunit Aph-1 n=1 Tax=Elliptochloris bilobata TaxID=381761 RepID=A0AAW1QZN2_9CHLO